MSIEKEYGKFVPVCDRCGNELMPEDTWQDAVDAKKDAGWRSVKDKGEWVDVCPECQEVN